MTWTRLGDDYAARRYDLSDAAFRLELAALVESNRLGWGGRIQKDRVKLLVPRHEVAELGRIIPLPRMEWADGAVFAASAGRAAEEPP